MNAFLDALGSKLAERWLAVLVLPGALFTATAGIAVTLGHTHWNQPDRLRRAASGVLAQSGGRDTTVIVVSLVVLAAVSTVAGLLVRAVGSGLERVLLTESANPLTRRLVARRRRRWQAADERFEAALLAAGEARAAGEPDADERLAEAERLNARRNRISLTRPARPFWLGDRFASVDRRVLTAYDLDLASAWPRLWLVLPDSVRGELHAVRTGWSAAVRLVAWGLAYLALGTLWWPAAVLGAAVVLTGRRRSRTTGAVFSDLIESTVDNQVRALAATLGFECAGPVTSEVGAAITELLRKKA